MCILSAPLWLLLLVHFAADVCTVYADAHVCTAVVAADDERTAVVVFGTGLVSVSRYHGSANSIPVLLELPMDSVTVTK